MSKPPNGPIVKHLRETRRYTQAEFAKMAGISKDALSRIELGKPKGTRPRQKTVPRCLAWVGTSPFWQPKVEFPGYQVNDCDQVAG